MAKTSGWKAAKSYPHNDSRTVYRKYKGCTVEVSGAGPRSFRYRAKILDHYGQPEVKVATFASESEARRQGLRACGQLLRRWR
jgi:hypothetical protein